MSNTNEIVPNSKLNRSMLVPLTELEQYQIYTGFDGRELKLDNNGYCNTWFESINPLYNDYLFQIPFGRPRQTKLGEWNIVIKKKEFANISEFEDMDYDDYMIVESYKDLYQLKKGEGNVYYSNHQELAKYLFIESKKQKEHYMELTFKRVPNESWHREQQIIITELYNWVLNLTKSGKPITLTYE